MSTPIAEPLVPELDALCRTLCEQTSDAIALFEVLTPRRFVLEWLNAACAQALALPDDAVGKTIHELWSPEVADSLLAAFQSALDGAAPATIELAWPLGGGPRWFQAALVPICRPGLPAHRLAAVCRDTTDRKAFEKALGDREGMLRRLVETTNVIPWEADFHTRRFTYVGPRAVERFGYPAAEWLRPGFLFDHIHPDDRETWANIADSALRPGEAAAAYAQEYRLLARDGEAVWVYDLVNLVLDGDGKPLLHGFLVDVTARRQAEEEVRRLNNELEQRVVERTAQLEGANKELEAFCYSVSHDLRAPLRAIDGFGKALLEDCGDRLNAEGLDSLHRVRAASQRMGELIDDLLLLSRVSRSEMRRGPVSLSELAEEVRAALHNQAPERRVDWVIAAGLCADGDRALLQVVLENLLGNAWKYTGRHPRARIEVGSCGEGRKVFFVRDDGAGFDPAYADKLFRPFYRLHRVDEFAGHGIGLATVQRIIHRHGGSVWAEGAVEKGATFFFTL
jgi:PAS domain S-box-containing protein